ncbi:MAG: hypothetical protein ACPG7F_12500, partial [Aggregatilineales bacterium]
THFQLAPWCYQSDKGVYHDFHAIYTDNPDLLNLLTDVDRSIIMTDDNGQNLMRWYEAGYLVPVF